MKVGDDVTVTGWLARSEPNLGAVRNVTFADGRKLAAGPPGRHGRSVGPRFAQHSRGDST